MVIIPIIIGVEGGAYYVYKLGARADMSTRWYLDGDKSFGFAIALVPCGFMLLAFVIIWFYPLTDKKFKEIVVEIDNRKKVQQQLINDITS